MKKETKKILKIAAYGHLALWSVFFLGVSITLMTQASDIILIGLYAVIAFVLLSFFCIGFKQLPIKY